MNALKINPELPTLGHVCTEGRPKNGEGKTRWQSTTRNATSLPNPIVIERDFRFELGAFIWPVALKRRHPA
jgi:hypothetical protein